MRKIILGTFVPFLRFQYFLVVAIFASITGVQAQTKISVDIDKPEHVISPTLFGIFFEDINLSADGGIYPEMVRNRSFEDADTLQNWKFICAEGKSQASISSANGYSEAAVLPLNPFNRKSICIQVNGSFTLENDGYWGMNIVQGNSYLLNFAARSTDGFNAALTFRVVTNKGKELLKGEIKGFDATWKYYSLNLIASAGDPTAHLEISGVGSGKLYLDMISLMPKETWKNHGLRIDLAEALDSLSPKFLRFPGGCWVEGNDFAHMNNWKNTIGNINTRTPLWNIWGYNATHGLGYHEYLQLAEDLGTEPLFCINAGMSHNEVIPLDQMGQWVQDALDAIEYANGAENSVWGSIRSKNGHPESFNLKYLEIGNENGRQPYAERWALMANAIHAKYPDVKLIANNWSGSHPHQPNPEIVDEHYYSNPDWFIWNANKYDNYDRNRPKVFIGEYAVNENTGNGNLRGAIGEAAFMIGMERNSDVVVMGAYAPLLCNANHRAWPVNLINFDSYRWYGLPSYYVQKLFAKNQGTVALPVKIEYAPNLKANFVGCIGFGTHFNSAEFKDVQVTSPEGKTLFKPDFSKMNDDWRKSGKGEWSVKDGVLKQSLIAPDVKIFMGDSTWANYTLTLKSRKISGTDGFKIYFHNRNNKDNSRWDLGGWNNQLLNIDMGFFEQNLAGSIEAGRWYDIKLEIRGASIKTYLDGQLIQEISEANSKVKCLTASAARDYQSGDIILKIVNTSAQGLKSQINLNGTGKLTGTGNITVLTSASPLDENTLDEPTKVSPRTEKVKFTGNVMTRLFPGNSLTIIRLGIKK